MSSNPSSPPPLSHILETCIYARDLSASVEFYKGIFNIKPFLETPRMSGFSLGQTTLLLFQIGSTHEDVHLQNGTIPGHGPTETIRHSLLTPSDTPTEKNPKLKQHFCLAVNNPEDVDRWDEHLRNKGVNVTARMKWERGGRSIYFEDPDGHVGEIASRGLWAHY
ncbi:hypothetical protein DTO166G4_3199 [Paecilomyces variotii]|uniref:Glyoxalase/Bleomycin resistance protein/Dihydroxybiphenyl dioxygenase n=1 Tax=Byssochlamys spectabilis TaxID=264951 RepID=A0A443HL72_BYSSP|nr:Glyoxalase/Bleomycin resistance protein/Dihydroxybiphenyl dioxygenase [Paecilomyces variotii]KAJ9215121.1 hypothetical protein DTO166G4_3199 [Paecilomyces variotii]KAJ9231526.1 hypothetical protein DTO166G5_6729 [Paecilomyces variotii]KAJ9258168.1 hypothetical protein DTO195F2_5393 [Paecilomyces variotii]KAJ9270474.1 hypothetical protein DTO212C5_3505 [Paecilomyces variotii]KAJ9284734.1 hypothetical protein DTO021C3_7676 [Paecilomyces variotii]